MTQLLSMTVAKYLLTKIVQAKGSICQSHAIKNNNNNKQFAGIQSSFSWQGEDGILIYPIQLSSTCLALRCATTATI